MPDEKIEKEVSGPSVETGCTGQVPTEDSGVGGQPTEPSLTVPEPEQKQEIPTALPEATPEPQAAVPAPVAGDGTEPTETTSQFQHEVSQGQVAAGMGEPPSAATSESNVRTAG